MRCGARELDWRVSAARGTVYAATTVTQASGKEFEAIAPFRLLLVNLDEGIRIMAHGDDHLDIGDRAIAGFKSVGGYTLPYFRWQSRDSLEN
jgi:uncharacterized OB-fold protein